MNFASQFPTHVFDQLIVDQFLPHLARAGLQGSPSGAAEWLVETSPARFAPDGAPSTTMWMSEISGEVFGMDEGSPHIESALGAVSARELCR